MLAVFAVENRSDGNKCSYGCNVSVSDCLLVVFCFLLKAVLFLSEAMVVFWILYYICVCDPLF